TGAGRTSDGDPTPIGKSISCRLVLLHDRNAVQCDLTLFQRTVPTLSKIAWPLQTCGSKRSATSNHHRINRLDSLAFPGYWPESSRLSFSHTDVSCRFWCSCKIAHCRAAFRSMRVGMSEATCGYYSPLQKRRSG